MVVWDIAIFVEFVWLLHSLLLGSYSAQTQNVPTMVICRTFAANETAYAVCSTDAFNLTSEYMPNDDDPCSRNSSKMMCDRLDILSPTSCLSRRSAGVI